MLNPRAEITHALTDELSNLFLKAFLYVMVFAFGNFPMTGKTAGLGFHDMLPPFRPYMDSLPYMV